MQLYLIHIPLNQPKKSSLYIIFMFSGGTLIDQDICNGNFSVVTRTEWEGRPSKKNEYMGTPTSILFIHHSAGSECFSLAECSREVRRIQDYHMIDKGKIKY